MRVEVIFLTFKTKNVNSIFWRILFTMNTYFCFISDLFCVDLKRLFCVLSVLQAVYYRTIESLFLPSDGDVDSHHRPTLYNQTSASGSADLCPRLSAHFLFCYEYSGGEVLSELCIINESICKCE